MRSYRKKRKLRKTRKRRQRGGNPDKCIFVNLFAGIGNQLFMYAAALTVKDRTKLPICLLPIKHNKHSSKDYRSILFKHGRPVDLNEATARINTATKVLGDVVHANSPWANTNIPENSNKDLILAENYYQNYKSIEPVIPIIREDCKKAFEELYPDMKGKIPANSAFMHVRRGDYHEMEISLDREYYQRALKELDLATDIKDIYILSDDMSWCKEQNWVSSKAIQWFESPNELECLYLMSLCMAGAIISASTFSLWGVILGADQNPSSTIVYPSSWATGPSKSLEFPSRWKAI